MDLIAKLRARLARSGANDDLLYECKVCGTGFELERHVCPVCGGYSVENARW